MHSSFSLARNAIAGVRRSFCTAANNSNSSIIMTKKTLRGVVFDMDGTLTKPVIDFKLMRSRVGVPDGKDILDFISTQSVEQQALSHAAIKDVEAQALVDMSAMPGVHELCEMLDTKTIPRGLITRNVASSVAHFHANHMGPLLPFTPAISRECPHEYKPSPAALLHICKTWGVLPSEVMMVGDSLKDDIVSGNRAGCVTVLLDYEVSPARTPEEFPEGELRPDFVVASLQEVHELLLNQFSLEPAPVPVNLVVA